MGSVSDTSDDEDDSQPLSCAQCLKSSPSKKSLVAHLASFHSPIKSVVDSVGSNGRFVCVQCGKSFIYLSLLERHVNIVHLGVPKHKCGNCGQISPSKELFALHQLVCMK